MTTVTYGPVQRAPNYNLKSLFAMSAFVAFLTGCTSINEINNDLFDDPEDLELKISNTQEGMTVEQVVNTLGVPKRKFKPMGNAREFKAMFGQEARLEGTIHELMEGREFLNRVDIIRLPYKSVTKSFSVDFPASYREDSAGHDMEAYFVFLDGKLQGKVDLAYDENVESTNTKAILPDLIQEIIPMAKRVFMP